MSVEVLSLSVDLYFKFLESSAGFVGSLSLLKIQKSRINHTISRKIENFRSEYEYQIEYEYDFRISNQLRSQNHRSSLLLISRGEGSGNNIGVLCDDLGCKP